MPATARDIVNEAIQLIGGNQPLVTGNAPNFDESTTGKVAQQIYAPCVAAAGRQFEWDFARNTFALVPTGNVAPIPWTFEYAYPPNGIEVWQLMPAAPDPFDPLPVNFIVANTIVNGQQARVVQTNVPAAIAVYNNNPGPDVWDASFRAAVVRLLASEFAMALGGKPDVAQAAMENASVFAQGAAARQN